MVRWVAILAKTCRVGSRPPPDLDDAREVSRGVRRTPSRRSGRVAAVVRRRRRAGQLRCRRAATHPAGVRVSIRIEVVGQPVTPESGRNRCRRRGGCVRPHPVLSERPPGPWHVPGMCGQRRWPRGPRLHGDGQRPHACRGQRARDHRHASGIGRNAFRRRQSQLPQLREERPIPAVSRRCWSVSRRGIRWCVWRHREGERPVSLAELLASDEPVRVSEALTITPSALSDQVRGTAPTVPAPRHDRVPAGRARRVTAVTAVGVTAVAHASILDPCRRRGSAGRPGQAVARLCTRPAAGFSGDLQFGTGR
jgi:hypothetical protein